ncbi:MAG: alpha/beta hydrolase [Robiginitalea sp.]|uniref:alpha/beta fold hydrolase n=1 Tax=Robiginitalea sp. TaxID=1902411 RepID=UPI003C727A18
MIFRFSFPYKPPLLFRVNIAMFFLLMLSSGHTALAQGTEAALKALPIDTHEVVSLSDSRQYIRIKGSPSNPIFLFLAGGPGDSVTGSMKQLFSKLSGEFLVVLWDIRSTGETAKLDNPPRELSQQLFQEDTRELVDYLLSKFKKEKLYLAGFSWGSVPGFYMAAEHPEKLHAFIAVNPMIDPMKSEAISLKALKEDALADDNKTALAELSQVQLPFQNAEQLYYSRKWLFLKEGNRFGQKKAFRKYVFDWSDTWLDVFNQAVQRNLFETLPTLECPVFFIVGKKDYRIHYSIAQDYYQQVKAPEKDFFLFENSGHLIPYRDQNRFQETIIDSILKN